MRATAVARGAVLALAVLVFIPAAAVAQSAVAGVVKDSSGGVLPGVTVEAASPALIERSRTAVTDGQGLYQVIDLRPGVYSVTFTLPGFQSVKREGIELTSSFTATVNADMQVSSVSETVTVSGAAPTVDVRNALVQTVMTRQLLDAIPTGRSYQSIAQMTPGVVLDRADQAGSEAFFSTNLHVHGSMTRDQSIQLDGMDTTDGESDGRFQGMYRDDGDNEEVAYSTSAISAETSKGGVRINMIGREGGNAFKGSLFTAYVPGGLQNSNYSDELRAAGLATPNAMKRIFDFNPTLGGPLMRDRLWFFSSFRVWGVDKYAAGAFNPDGSRALDDAQHVSASTRLTSQLSPRNKLMAYYARMVQRTLYHRFIGPTVTPEASSLQTTPIGYSAQLKWSSPVTNRLLLQAGFSTTFVHPSIYPQPRVVADPTIIAKSDLTTTGRFNAYPTQSDLYKGRRYYEATAAYVTGSHAYKTGVQMSEVRSRNTTKVNGDIVQEYRSGVPSSVLVYNTPTDQQVHLVPDLGIYAQDAWRIKRLTANYGVRFEHFAAQIDARSLPAGRFVGARQFAEIVNIPNWTNISPRLGLVYDLTGNGRTAVKLSINKYMMGESVSFTESYNPNGTVTDRRTWTDLNRDDIAQDNEIGPSNIANFGTRQLSHPDPDIKRPYQIEYNVSVQRELFSGVSFSGGFFRRQYYHLYGTKNLAASFSDYTPVTIVSPLDGQNITIYNLNPARRGAVDNLDYTSENNTRKYNGFEISMGARLPRGGSMFGGMTVGKTVDVNCDVPDPNQLRFCDPTSYIPYQAVYKLSGTYPLPLGLQVSGTLQSNPGNPVNAQATGERGSPEAGLNVNYNVTPAIVPGLTQPLIVVKLIPPGTKYLDRVNQFDVRLSKNLQVGSTRLVGSIDVFNLLNTNAVLRQVEVYGPALGRPDEIPQGRLYRFAVQMRF